MYHSFTTQQIKVIEPELQRCFGIDHYMIIEEISYAFAYFGENNLENLSDKGRQLLEECRDPDTGTVNVDTFMMQTNAELELDLGDDRDEKSIFQIIYDHKISLEEQNSWEFFYSLCFAVVILTKYEKGTLSNTLEEQNHDLWKYQQKVRPDMLELYKAFECDRRVRETKNRKSTFKDREITLKCGSNKPIHINNEDFWFTNMMFEYLNKYLGVSSLEEAEEELNTIYGKKSGRKSEQPLFDIYLYGTYQLLQNTSLKTPEGGKITANQCKFIRDFLCYINFIDEDDFMKDENYISSKLTYLMKHNFRPDWYKMIDKPYNSSPNNSNPHKLY